MAERVMARRVDEPPMPDQRDAQRSAPIRDWPAREAIDPHEDKLSLPPSVKAPEGFVYERKRYSTLNQVDHAHYNRMLRAGWRPVPASRHPELTPDPASPSGAFVQDGLILMERPEAYNIAARAEERDRAAMQVATQLTRIGHTEEGQAPRVAKSSRDPRLGFKTGYAPVPVDADEGE